MEAVRTFVAGGDDRIGDASRAFQCCNLLGALDARAGDDDLRMTPHGGCDTVGANLWRRHWQWLDQLRRQDRRGRTDHVGQRVQASAELEGRPGDVDVHARRLSLELEQVRFGGIPFVHPAAHRRNQRGEAFPTRRQGLEESPCLQRLDIELRRSQRHLRIHALKSGERQVAVGVGDTEP